MNNKMESMYTSDLHINHIKCSLEWRGFNTVEEHNDFIIDSFNSVVGNKDRKVFILGDAVFQPATSLHLLDRLYGKKILIMGNHDVDARRYYPYVETVLGYYGHDAGLVLSHIPVHPSQLDERFTANIHGHIHISGNQPGIDDPRYLNVNCEFHNYKPLTISQIKEYLEFKKEGLYNEYKR